ncbi:MAG: MoaD/ThiS family protein [Nitrospirae bacterium]|nr:MoaD/ThiS family protein [Nitrospirota bacterium]
MQVSVRFYAKAQELAGLSAALMEVSPPVTVADFRRLLSERFPRLSGMERSLALAVVERLPGETADPLDARPAMVVTDAYQFNGSEEVLVLPPVSGG